MNEKFLLFSISLFLLTLPNPIFSITYCNNAFECSSSEICRSGICINACNGQTCGENAECDASNHEAYCVCDEDHVGNPLERCWPIGSDPCTPNPCGDNSKCVAKGKRGPFCLCQEGFFGKPPNCHSGCTNSTQCASNEFCEHHKCVDPCGDKNFPCGDNSRCRSENHSRAICACRNDFFPEKGIGCRPTIKDDQKIDLKFIENQLKSKCDVTCGTNAFCTEQGDCKCSEGFTGDAKNICLVDPKPEKVDRCSPTPCGPFAKCSIIGDTYNCTCLEGYRGSPPFCYPCTDTRSCGSDQLCVSGKCVKNICEKMCGKYADCRVVERDVLCSCENEGGNPFKECEGGGSVSSLSNCKDEATRPECGVLLLDVTKVLLAAG